MTGYYLSFASLRGDASTRAMIRALSPSDPDRALDTHHQLVWTLFADEARPEARRSFLWRVDGDRFFILSMDVPQDDHSLFDLQVRRFDVTFDEGDRFVFRLRANATVCRTENAGGARRQQRHDVVMDRLRGLQGETPGLSRAEARERAVPEAASGWLARTGERTGFALERLGTTSYRTADLGRRGGSRARFGILDMEGVLTVRQPERFSAAVREGFGRAKAFGCGLMLLANESR